LSFGEALAAWKSTTSRRVTLSSDEVEHDALAKVTKDVMLVKQNKFYKVWEL
jgi:hypothetical protein